LVTTPGAILPAKRLGLLCFLHAAPLAVLLSPPDGFMGTVLLPSELRSIEKPREQELEEARVTQNVMLPARPLRLAGVTISHEFQPVTEVGGDYLDYFKLSDETIGLYVGDVSRKGLPAALYAALAVGTLRGIHKTGMEPERVLSLLNERLLLRGHSRAPLCYPVRIVPSRHRSNPYRQRLIARSSSAPGRRFEHPSDCWPATRPLFRSDL
jgi:hypothetical protein